MIGIISFLLSKILIYLLLKWLAICSFNKLWFLSWLLFIGSIISVMTKASLIIIDEISMCPVHALNAVDRLLKDIAPTKNRNTMFGGKTILLCGDFHQILPVLPHARQAAIVENCVQSFQHWSEIKQFTLTQNIRTLSNEIEFAEFLKKVGNGSLQLHSELGVDIIEIPDPNIGKGSIIEETYDNLNDSLLTSSIIDKAILTPMNEFCIVINNKIIEQMAGDVKIYYNIDSIVSDDEHVQNQFPTEFLNSLSISGLSPHKLLLKENAIVILMRNLNTTQALINGTRMRVKFMHKYFIDCEVLTGISACDRILIPRILLCPSEALLPFRLQRLQFPIILAFAMTINKAQVQSLKKVGVYLPEPVFAHGQLYVAMSRTSSSERLKRYITKTKDQGFRYLKDKKILFTKN